MNFKDLLGIFCFVFVVVGKNEKKKKNQEKRRIFKEPQILKKSNRKRSQLISRQMKSPNMRKIGNLFTQRTEAHTAVKKVEVRVCGEKKKKRGRKKRRRKKRGREKRGKTNVRSNPVQV